MSTHPGPLCPCQKCRLQQLKRSRILREARERNAELEETIEKAQDAKAGKYDK